MVRSLNLVRNVGRFYNVATGAALPFSRVTVVYAENGRGKTTLAAILRSLASGQAGPILERRRLGAQHPPHVVVDLDGGAAATFQNGAWSRTAPNVVIFHDNFVAANVCSGIEVAASHRQNLHELIVGAQGVALNAALQAEVDKIEIHNQDLRAKGDAIPSHRRGALALLWQIMDEPRSAAGTSVRHGREELVQDGLSDRRQARLRRRRGDSFFPHSPG